MLFAGFKCVNEEKLERAIHGLKNGDKEVFRGVGDEATPDAVLANYDKLGGLILKDGQIVKMGSFYDFIKKKPREEAEIAFLIDIDGQRVEVSEDEAKAVSSAKAKVERLKVRAKKKEKKDEE
jgi:2-keto-4-pentenoate hydratase